MDGVAITLLNSPSVLLTSDCCVCRSEDSSSSLSSILGHTLSSVSSKMVSLAIGFVIEPEFICSDGLSDTKSTS